MNSLDKTSAPQTTGKSLTLKRQVAWAILPLILILAVALYEKWGKPSELVYSVSPSKTAIYKNGEPSRVTILIDSQKVAGDVSSLKIGFWNRGRKPIRASDIRAAIEIKADPAHPIYSAKIVRVTDDTSGMKLDLTGQSAGTVGLTWNVLGKGEGGVVQLIYGGSSDLSPSIQGAIAGQKSIKNMDLKSLWPISTTSVTPATATSGMSADSYVEIVLLLFVFLLFAVYFIYALVRLVKIRHEPEFDIVVTVEIVTLLLFLASIWLVVYFVVQSHMVPGTAVDF